MSVGRQMSLAKGCMWQECLSVMPSQDIVAADTVYNLKLQSYSLVVLCKDA